MAVHGSNKMGNRNLTQESLYRQLLNERNATKSQKLFSTAETVNDLRDFNKRMLEKESLSVDCLEIARNAPQEIREQVESII
jgi:hypothetical protein